MPLYIWMHPSVRKWKSKYILKWMLIPNEPWKRVGFSFWTPSNWGLCRHRGPQATELMTDVWRRTAGRRSWCVTGNQAGPLILWTNTFNLLRMLINESKALGSLMHGLISWLNWEITVQFPFFNIISYTIKNHSGIRDQICFQDSAPTNFLHRGSFWEPCMSLYYMPLLIIHVQFSYQSRLLATTSWQISMILCDNFQFLNWFWFLVPYCINPLINSFNWCVSISQKHTNTFKK